MQLNTFDGGLSVRLAPSLINLNEGVVYTNIDSAKGVLASGKDITDANQEVRGYFYLYKGTWLSSYLERTYVEYKDLLYYTEKNTTAKKNNGTRETTLGIAAPLVKLTTVQTDPADANVISTDAEVLQYTYTYYNNIDGVESAPAPISDELTLAASKVVTVSDFVISTDTQVDKIKLYRIGADATTMTLVATLDNDDADYIDTATTLELPGNILDSYDNGVPITGLKYLTEAYGIMFAALDDKLYYSKIGKPDAWPASFYIDFSREITGILPVSNGILIQSEYKTDILIGSKPSDFAVLPVSIEQGSIAHASGRTVKVLPVWASKEGICTYASGAIEVISKDKLDTVSLSIVNTAVIDEQYYICLTDGSLLVMDARFGKIFKRFTFTKLLSNIAVFNGILYCSVGDRLYTVFTGDDLELRYVSPVFTEGNHSVNKLYNNIYIRADGEFNIKILIDDELVHTVDLANSKVYDVKVPAEKQDGCQLQFDITGIGQIQEIEWKVVGRQNGR